MSSRILYLSFNDGSDMRVNKELRTLSQVAEVELVALGEDPAQCYAAQLVHTLHFIRGPRKSLGTLARYFLSCIRLLLSHSYSSVHIINEPQLLALWPFLWFQKNVVLDLFDSIFLKKNRPGNKWRLLKKITYAPVSRIIVTDENRFGLLPDFAKPLSTIVPNYPYYIPSPPPKERSPGLTIMYYGWLGELRGTETIRNLLAHDPNLRVLMAGWLADEPSRQLTNHPQVEWLGVLPQEQALGIVARRADYILCVYAPTNENNINASPNKIYDAIQVRTPVIMNAEVQVSNFVQSNWIGYILPNYRISDHLQITRELFEKRCNYAFTEDLRETYTWQKAEGALVKAHGV